MKIAIDRSKKLILLKWLKQGYINTLDMPEAMEGFNIFQELMMALDEGDDGVC